MTKRKNLRVVLSTRQQMVASTSPIPLALGKGVLKPCKNSIPISMSMEVHQKPLNRRKEKPETEAVSQQGMSHKAIASPKKSIPQATQDCLILGDNVPGLSITEEKKSVLASESIWEMVANGGMPQGIRQLIPTEHSALSFSPGQAGADPTYGHIAFVEQVKSDGSILISESNIKGLGVVSYRTFDAETAKQITYVIGH